MGDTEGAPPQSARKLKTDDRFQPAKRNLMWVSVLSVALAFADTASTKSADLGTVDTVKIPGLDLSFPVGIAATFLFIAMIYCFGEYWLEYLTAKTENSNAANQDISLSSLFDQQERTIRQAIIRIERAAAETGNVPMKVDEAMNQWNNGLRPDYYGLAQNIRALQSDAGNSLEHGMSVGGLDEKSKRIIRAFVWDKLFQTMEQDFRRFGQAKLLPANPPPIFANTQVESIRSDLKNIAIELGDMDGTQRLLAKDFSTLNKSLYGPQKMRFYWIDFFIPCLSAALGILASCYMMLVSLSNLLSSLPMDPRPGYFLTVLKLAYSVVRFPFVVV